MRKRLCAPLCVSQSRLERKGASATSQSRIGLLSKSFPSFFWPETEYLVWSGNSINKGYLGWFDAFLEVFLSTCVKYTLKTLYKLHAFDPLKQPRSDYSLVQWSNALLVPLSDRHYQTEAQKCFSRLSRTNFGTWSTFYTNVPNRFLWPSVRWSVM